MPYRHQERHGLSWNAEAFRDREDSRGGSGRRPTSRPDASRHQEEIEDELYDWSDNDEYDCAR